MNLKNDRRKLSVLLDRFSEFAFELIPHPRRLKSTNKQLIQSLKQLFSELIATDIMGRRGYGRLFEALLKHG
jgi:hypothetical protein